MGGYDSNSTTSSGSTADLITLPNVTALRADIGAAGFARALRGYSSFADGGEGIFFWDPSNAVDDGVLRFNIGGLGSNSPGWQREYNGGPISVLWSGAKGDGVTDDKVAIQRVLDLFDDVDVLIPPDFDFLIGSQLIVSKVGTRISGSPGSKIRASVASFDMLELRANNITIENVELWGDATDDTTTQYGVVTNGLPGYVQGAAANFAAITNGQTLIFKIDGRSYTTTFLTGDTTQKKVIDRINATLGGGPDAMCCIQSVSGTQIALASRSIGPTSSVEIVGGSAAASCGLTVGTSTGSGYSAQYCRILNVKFTGDSTNRLNNGIKILSGCDYWEVLDCFFSLMGFSGVVGNGYGLNTGARGIQLKNSIFIGDTSGGRHLVYLGGGARDCQVQNNLVNYSNANSINGTSLAYQLPNINNIVSNNTLANQVASADDFSFAAISLTGAFYDTLIEGNIIRDIGDHGIYMSGLGQITDNIGTPHDAVIRDNSITRVGKHGINVETVKRCQIHDNCIRDAGLKTAATYVGIQAAAYTDATTICDRVECKNNTVRASDPANPTFVYSVRFDPTAGQGPTNSAIIYNDLNPGSSGVLSFDSTVPILVSGNKTDALTATPTSSNVTVSGARNQNAALASLLTSLANEGLITDSSSAGQSEVTGSYLGTTVLTAGTTFTTTAKTNKIKIRMVGGGGGGGGANTAAVSAGLAGGGGAGGYAEKTFTVAPSTGYTYAIGTGGAGGVGTTPTNGTAGNDTTFTVGGTTVTAKGGLAGNATNAGVSPAVTGGSGHSNVSTNGDLNTFGQEGNPGLRFSGTIGCSGSGGSSQFGAGGRSFNSGSTGQAGAGYGAGGSGGAVTNGSAAADGGAGSDGVIIVDEFA